MLYFTMSVSYFYKLFIKNNKTKSNDQILSQSSAYDCQLI